MAFGKKQEGDGGSEGKRESRTITPIDREDKPAGKGIVYKIQDEKEKWYSCWDEEMADLLQQAGEAETPIKIGVEITQNGKYTNYTIRSIGDAVAAWVAEGPSSSGGGFKGGGRGRGMSPETDAKITKLALMKMAVHMTSIGSFGREKGWAPGELEAEILDNLGYLKVVLDAPYENAELPQKEVEEFPEFG